MLPTQLDVKRELGGEETRTRVDLCRYLGYKCKNKQRNKNQSLCFVVKFLF